MPREPRASSLFGADGDTIFQIWAEKGRISAEGGPHEAQPLTLAVLTKAVEKVGERRRERLDEIFGDRGRLGRDLKAHGVHMDM